MTDDGRQRRLSAILAADVAGYTRLVEQDTEGTVAAWKSARTDIIDPAIADHSGRIVKHTGDGFLSEFPTVQQAVECAIDMQEGLAASPLDFRMGINIGDVIDDGEDIHGEGVNIAARIEALADPGGISISGGVYDQVRNRLDHQFEDLGEHEVKNVSAPVRVYKVAIVRPTSGQPKGDTTELVLPDKPSIAVLPFDNMSGDPEQEFFVDGVVEDILTTLSKIRHLFVIARNSSFVYKGRSVDIRAVGAELGVQYVLEGSVRKAGNNVRLSAQLIDCEDGHHLWAERYDGQLDDVFELQDRITQKIVTALEVELAEGEQVRIWRERSGSPLVYEHFHKARDLYFAFAKDTNQQAQAEVERALSINPTYAPALILLGYIHADAARFGWTDDLEVSRVESLDCGRQAIDSDPESGEAYAHLGYLHLFMRDYESALEAAQKAVALSPNSSDACHTASMIQLYAGNAAEGARLARQALRLNPLMPTNSQLILGQALIHVDEYEEAISVLESVARRRPRWLTARTMLVAARSRMGETDEAKRLAAEVLRINPRFTVARWGDRFPYRDRGELDALMAPLLEAGLPHD